MSPASPTYYFPANCNVNIQPAYTCRSWPCCCALCMWRGGGGTSVCFYLLCAVPEGGGISRDTGCSSRRLGVSSKQYVIINLVTLRVCVQPPAIMHKGTRAGTSPGKGSRARFFFFSGCHRSVYTPASQRSPVAPPAARPKTRRATQGELLTKPRITAVDLSPPLLPQAPLGFRKDNF